MGSRRSIHAALRRSLPLLLVVAAAAIQYWRSPYSASDLGVVPDSVEYAVGAERLVSLGRYDLEMGGHSRPVRYPPWFSVLFIAPTYLLLGSSLGNAILPVFALAVAGVIASWFLGWQVGKNGWSAGLAATAVLLLHSYSRSASWVGVDVPLCALTIMLALLYVTIAQSERPQVWKFFWAGALVALAAGLRSTGLALLLPFAALAWNTPARRGRSGRLGALSVIPTAWVLASMAYNARTFGSPLRTGYHYWCPIPYDYFDLTFSLSYVGTNLRGTFIKGGLLTSVLVLLCLRFAARRTAAGAPFRTDPLARFAALGLGPIVVLHSFYFFPGFRFVLPATALVLIMCATRAASLVAHWEPRWVNLVLGVVLVIAAAHRIGHPDSAPKRFERALLLRQRVPADAVIISSLDAVYLEALVLRGTQRSYVPLSRQVEYASKVVCPRRIATLDPPVANFYDHRAAGLLRAGAEDPFSYVAIDAPEEIRKALTRGTPVYLDTVDAACPEGDLRRFLASFRATAVAEGLYRLTPP
jgi:hypothetical protein